MSLASMTMLTLVLTLCTLALAVTGFWDHQAWWGAAGFLAATALATWATYALDRTVDSPVFSKGAA